MLQLKSLDVAIYSGPRYDDVVNTAHIDYFSVISVISLNLLVLPLDVGCGCAAKHRTIEFSQKIQDGCGTRKTQPEDEALGE